LKNSYPHRITGYARLNNNPEEIKLALRTIGPVMIVIPVFSSFYQVSASNPIVPKFNYSETFYGNHAMFLVGYDNNKQLYKCANSWSKNFGENGFCYFSYDWGFSEIWSCTDNILPPSPTNYKLTNGSTSHITQTGVPIILNIKLSNNDTPVPNEFIQSMYSGILQGGTSATTDENGIASFTIVSDIAGTANCQFVWFSNTGEKYGLTITATWTEIQPEPIVKKLFHVQTLPLPSTKTAEIQTQIDKLKSLGYSVYSTIAIQVVANSTEALAKVNSDKLTANGIPNIIINY
jgi:hypothetical protein